MSRVTVAALVCATHVACADSGDVKRTAPVALPPASSAMQRVASPAPAVTSSRTTAASTGATRRAEKSSGEKQRASGQSDSTRSRGGRRRLAFNDVDITDVGYDRGDPRAPVVVVDLSDFGCPYCGEFARETYPVIERDYVRTGKVYFKYVPFIAGAFPHAREATRGAECAADQGRFWEMFDRIYATQAEWRRGNAVDAQMAALAGTVPIDTARFAACYAEHRTDQRTARATDLANQLGVRVTPSFLVNDRPVQGALATAEFRRVIDAALLVAGMRR